MTSSETLIDIADDLKAMAKEPEAAALAGRLEDMAAELRRVSREIAPRASVAEPIMPFGPVLLPHLRSTF